MNKILISDFFLGQKVRYNGEIKSLIDVSVSTNRQDEIIQKQLLQWQEEDRLYSICPEVAVGLAVPRDPAEINITTAKVMTMNNTDVTDACNIGTQRSLELCKRHQIKHV
jgi:uncharacterized protein YbbK (DUF523 family)